ncbi:DUF3667 domain-containing protein [Aquimarina sp. AD1]|uniref:DUF3667 domain-containing protein n=1 Tax=Aquimarina sp. (strain AD1) TaxID=1714848 RepID=UPI000E513B92|nr:DUF3667 domain-containing protein [Aquimarina sp. AD1]AXT56349.1 DUF3667 domain-containing protein [Aquimarina sp. AD1]RKN13194.1 DUF3667 domain-containing protein [Aquimarina sp. AD1]
MSNYPTNINHCKNCGFQIDHYSFCPDCGAKKITKRITFKNLTQEFSDRFLNLDNSFIRTFIHLFTQPNTVIDGFIHGLRKRYVNVFSYFAISLTISSLYSFILGKYKDVIFSNVFTDANQIKASKVASDFSFEYQSVISFLTIPILALISRLVFINYKKYNLTEHFVIYLYAYSHITMVISFITLPLLLTVKNIYLILWVQFPVSIIYIAYVLKSLYEINLKKILIKTLFFIIIMSVLFVIFSIIVAIVMMKTGVMTGESTSSI